ncbi:MAG: metallophosphoesterase [Candidatus Korobacteraceae bacterium]
MSVVAIGDIHGNSEALADLLAQVLPQMKVEDTLVFLGDYIDRGPDSRGCVDLIIRLRKQYPFQVVTLLGNHEQWMLRSLSDPTQHSWLVGMDALETITNYSEEAALAIAQAIEEHGARLFTLRIPLPYDLFFGAMPVEHLEFFRQLKPCYRQQGVIYVHGGIDSDGSLDRLDVNTYVWGTPGFPEDYSGNDVVVYGHRNDAIIREDGRVEPRVGTNNTYGIDTIAHGILTALRMPDGRVFQSRRIRGSHDHPCRAE